MRCLRIPRTANPRILQLFKNAGIFGGVGGDNTVWTRKQQPVPLSYWAAASALTHRAFHYNKAPDADQEQSK